MSTGWRLLAAALVILFAVCAADQLELLHTAAFQLGRQDTGRPLWNAAIYVATYLAAVLGLAVAVCHRRAVSLATAALALVAACIQAGVTAVNGVGFTHHEAALLLGESDFLGAALGFFLPRYALAASVALVVGSSSLWLARRVGPRLRAWSWLLLPLAACVGAYDVVEQTFGKVYQFPAPVRVPLLTAFAWQHRLPIYTERDAPYFEPDEAPLADHIILVVDESISGHWLGVNGAGVDTTPWLSSAPAGVFNYGIASAISNLSSSSNILLQTGLRPEDLPDRTLRALRGPNLFAYAARAGFHTALIDAQTYSDAPPNLMTGFDLRRIETVVRLREADVALPEHAVDFAALPLIQRIVANHRRSFIYLIKTGAHLPYADKSPAAARAFSTLTPTDLRGIRHSYWDAIRWSSDRFLRELSRRLESSRKNVLVLYTSDHGQWLANERTKDLRISPHATLRDPPSEQASVPLLLLGFGDSVRAALSARFQPELVDRASGFQIFATLLQAAGYSAANTNAHHAPSLFEAGVEAVPRIFISGNIFARNAGAYVLNREIGDGCFVNPFDAEALRSPEP